MATTTVALSLKDASARRWLFQERRPSVEVASTVATAVVFVRKEK
jgi:hypothetical protein